MPSPPPIFVIFDVKLQSKHFLSSFLRSLDDLECCSQLSSLFYNSGDGLLAGLWVLESVSDALDHDDAGCQTANGVMLACV